MGYLIFIGVGHADAMLPPLVNYHEGCAYLEHELWVAKGTPMSVGCKELDKSCVRVREIPIWSLKPIPSVPQPLATLLEAHSGSVHHREVITHVFYQFDIAMIEYLM